MGAAREGAAAALAFAVLARIPSRRRLPRSLAANRVVAEAAGKASSGIMSWIWPPTRENAKNIVAVMIVGIGIIGYNFQQRRTVSEIHAHSFALHYQFFAAHCRS